jgi:FG-GAP repeat protein
MSGEGSGSAYVYVNNNGVWTEQAEIDLPMTAGGEEFGTSVALIGNTLLVGAYEADAEIGNAIIYVRGGNTWAQTGSVFPSDGTTGQRFANSVTMPDGNTFVCGSPAASYPSTRFRPRRGSGPIRRKRRLRRS